MCSFSVARAGMTSLLLLLQRGRVKRERERTTPPWQFRVAAFEPPVRFARPFQFEGVLPTSCAAGLSLSLYIYRYIHVSGATMNVCILSLQQKERESRNPLEKWLRGWAFSLGCGFLSPFHDEKRGKESSAVSGQLRGYT